MFCYDLSDISVSNCLFIIGKITLSRTLDIFWCKVILMSSRLGVINSNNYSLGVRLPSLKDNCRVITEN